MIGVDRRKELVSKLTPACHAALSEASNLCVAAGHSEVVIEHLLVALSKQDGNDLKFIFLNFEQDISTFTTAVENSFSRFRVNSGEMPILSPILFDLLEQAWLITGLELNGEKIRSGAILLAIIRDLGRYCRYEYVQLLEKISPEKLKKQFFVLTSGSVENELSPHKTQSGATNSNDQSMLERYAENFTQRAKDGKIDPVFCRESEIRQIIDILARRRKNNPICVGEAGVGKTAVIEGLALKIVKGEVPESLNGAEIYGLDLGALEAGASVKGEFEKRLKGVLDEVKNADHQIILFIDEAHTLIGAGGANGGGDAANLLKPALARGEIKTIAATTWSEYKKYFEKDPALTRRFQLVKLDEPTIEQTRTIIRGLIPAYEKAHQGIYISDAGIEAAVQLSSRYISGRQQPDKAIDVIDTACARVRAAQTGVPAAIENLKQKLATLSQEKQLLERDLSMGHESKALDERLSEIEDQIKTLSLDEAALIHAHKIQKELAEELRELRNSQQPEHVDEAIRTKIIALRDKFYDARKDEPLISFEVGAEEIAAVISEWTGIPASSMAQDEINRLLHLKDNISQVIKGQNHALDVIQEHLQTSRLDLHKKNRPLGVFLLIGPSGTGKTETAIEVANKLFGGEQFMTTVNMTEFQEKHTVSRLIGSPPGYVGFGEGGVLTEAIRKKPYSVVLLDEVEKADPDVLNLFYQVFDKGILTDGEGRAIDCRNVVFFLGSNLGSERISDLFFENPEITSEQLLTAIKPILVNHFKPALLARMEPIIYLPLNTAILREIIIAKVSELQTNCQERLGLTITIEEAVVEQLLALCNEVNSGARIIDRLLQKRILSKISQRILEYSLEDCKITAINVSAAENDFSFEFTLADSNALEKKQLEETVA